MSLAGDRSKDWAPAWERGRAAWPAVELPLEQFCAYLSEVAPPDSQRSETELHVTDLYLACAAGHGNPAALLLLEREHLQHVPRFIRKITTDLLIADEVLQALRTKLLVADGGRPKIFEYAGRGSLGAFLRVTAIRAAQSMVRQRDALAVATPLEDIDEAMGPPLDPDLALLREKLGPEVSAALRESIQKLTPVQRNLLRLHYFDGLSFERIGALFGVNRATSCRWVAEARRNVVTGTRRLLEERLSLRDSDLDAATRLLRSQLDVSFSTILRAG